MLQLLFALGPHACGGHFHLVALRFRLADSVPGTALSGLISRHGRGELDKLCPNDNQSLLEGLVAELARYPSVVQLAANAEGLAFQCFESGGRLLALTVQSDAAVVDSGAHAVATAVAAVFALVYAWVAHFRFCTALPVCSSSSSQNQPIRRSSVAAEENCRGSRQRLQDQDQHQEWERDRNRQHRCGGGTPHAVASMKQTRHFV
mmetsp:Transcript_16782/g.36078  ORF Transcript_16782/g.36078 Transcript_16782/m.36078 type:complete len:205 (+) Transcript_16782:1970-2584(+)